MKVPPKIRGRVRGKFEELQERRRKVRRRGIPGNNSFQYHSGQLSTQSALAVGQLIETKEKSAALRLTAYISSTPGY